ncbi:heterokaryon incompatibility protein-domain-containing protein [Chaetomidium leptoderma]|uniref:Heterokaryon incompatibility protein-domain-containing protein n=1 Tax=Chaetomidium leptoderma TaxID=669021 RepID=A0AAN6ZTV5_9PEZI|nr:heterokaryon incompatibility protein-domain-containing protein [Chaetomidium leptoderma]
MDALVIEGGPESKEPYQYQALPTLTSIRVLRMTGNASDEMVNVSLRIADLEDDPFFYALSYTWGNPHANGVDFTAHFNAVNEDYGVSQKTPVLCDGKVLQIQRNLLDVLNVFLTLSGGHQSQGLSQGLSPDPLTAQTILLANGELGIWIDAICINQDDMEERAMQVRIMDKIYAKAARTLIWLGSADKYTPAAAETIRRVAAYPKDVFVQSKVKPFRRQDTEVYAESNLAYTGWMDWCSLAAFLKRQWFIRLWIIQETILSRDLGLICGEHVISWADLVAAARNIEARCRALGWSPSTLFLQAHEVAVPLEHNVLRLADWRDYYHNKATTAAAPEAWRFTLEDLVYDTWIFVSTDPRDKIYGILGLVEPEVRAAWEIDYQSSVEEVYAITTRRIIEQSRSLKILSCVQAASRRKIAIYPSWVPDYSLPYFNMMCNHGAFAAAGTQHQTPQLVLPSDPSSAAHSGSPSLSSWSRLRLRAHVFDTIVETANERTEYVNSAMLLEPSWFELALLLKTPYPATGQRRSEVLWRTLCADQDATSTTSPAPARFGGLFKELICAMVVVRAELEEEVSQEPDPPEDCATSFAQAMTRAKEIWADVGWDRLTPEQLREKTNSRPKLLWRPEFGWLVHTLIKLQALVLTEHGGGEADTPSWEELERFYENQTYVMRVKNGESKSLVDPSDPGFTNSFCRRYGKRKLFYTAKGHLGLGPASTGVGDIVCILPGSAGPFVFQEDPDGGVKSEDGHDDSEDESRGKRLRLIGESYVHGIMYGEALESEGFVLEEIEIV